MQSVALQRKQSRAECRGAKRCYASLVNALLHIELCSTTLRSAPLRFTPLCSAQLQFATLGSALLTVYSTLVRYATICSAMLGSACPPFFWSPTVNGHSRGLHHNNRHRQGSNLYPRTWLYRLSFILNYSKTPI